MISTEELERITAESNISFALQYALDGIVLPQTHIEKTPGRVIKAWKEMTEGYKMSVDFTTFPAPDDKNWIVMRNIPFHSLCSHHIMPFVGTVDIAYFPSDIICGFSKLPRVVEMFSKRLQVQELLGSDIRGFIAAHLHTPAVCVRITSKHSCMACRGIESDAEAVTYHFPTGADYVFMNNLFDGGRAK